MDSIHLTISIVTYNNDFNILSDAVKSVLQSSLPLRLFLIDNASAAAFRYQFADDRIEILQLEENIGYGSGHNIAMRKSLELNAQYHLVLNPDVRFEAGTLENIYAYMQAHPKVGNLMPKVYYPNGEMQYLCKLLPNPWIWLGRRFFSFLPSFKKSNAKFELRFWGYDRVAVIPYLSGCFMFLNTDVIRKIGFFDEKIFLYAEDCDYSRRVLASGFDNLFYPKASIIHHFAKGSHKDWKLTKIAIQSTLYYFKKWGWGRDTMRDKINEDTLAKLSGTQ